MLTFARDDLRSKAERILELRPDPVPRFRLLRDVLGLSPPAPAMAVVQAAITTSRWHALLESSQAPDGTWDRFHTQDTSVKQPFVTTEAAVACALDIGLDRGSPILEKALVPIVSYVKGSTIWPDPPEKHDNPLGWPIWVRHYSAAVLSQIDRQHPALDEFRTLWAEAVAVAFASGTYDRHAEVRALNDLMACRMKAPVPCHTKYPLLIVSAGAHTLPEPIERALLSFVMHSPSGITYVFDHAIDGLPAITDRRFWAWTQAHRLLARFSLWNELSEDALNWIWAQRSPDGLWDPGSQLAHRPFTSFPLSESWRRPANRAIDFSVEMLTLLSRAFG